MERRKRIRFSLKSHGDVTVFQTHPLLGPDAGLPTATAKAPTGVLAGVGWGRRAGVMPDCSSSVSPEASCSSSCCWATEPTATVPAHE